MGDRQDPASPELLERNVPFGLHKGGTICYNRGMEIAKTTAPTIKTTAPIITTTPVVVMMMMVVAHLRHCTSKEVSP